MRLRPSLVGTTVIADATYRGTLKKKKKIFHEVGRGEIKILEVENEKSLNGLVSLILYIDEETDS